jgi:hypothetical protein
MRSRASLEVGVGLTVVELGGDDQRADDGPAVCAAIGAGVQLVLPAECDRPDGPFHGVSGEFDVAVLDVSAEGVPANQGVGSSGVVP